jgi:hypothetical protein
MGNYSTLTVNERNDNKFSYRGKNVSSLWVGVLLGTFYDTGIFLRCTVKSSNFVILSSENIFFAKLF